MSSRPEVRGASGHEFIRQRYQRGLLIPVAVGVAVVSAVLLAFGGALPVVSGGTAGFNSAPLLIALAVVPVAVAAALLLWRRRETAAGVLVGLAALVPGRSLLDLQFAVDASVTSRPALYLPRTLGSPVPDVGLWFLLAGQAGLIVAGALAVGAVRADSEPPVATEQRRGRRLLLLGGCLAALAAIGLLMAPYTSTDAYLLGHGALGGGGFVLAGSVMLAAGIPLAAAMATSTGRLRFARGCLAGLGFGTLTVCLPDLTAGLAMSALVPDAGAIVATAGGVGLLVLACAARSRQARVASAEVENQAGHARVPSQRRLEIGTGTCGILVGAAALLGSLSKQVTSAVGPLAAEAPVRWPLLVAGLATAAFGASMLVRGAARSLRPALAVVWVSVPIAGMSVLDTGLAAGESGGVLTPGPGVLWTVLAMVLAVVTACLAAVTGMVEREDVPHSTAGGKLAALAGAGAVLAAVGFALPVAESDDYTAVGLVTNLTTSSWGLLAGLVAVLSVTALAPYSRRGRAAAMLTGAACLSGLHAARLPLVGLRVGALESGPGWWFALAGAVVLLVSAIAFTASGRRAGTRV